MVVPIWLLIAIGIAFVMGLGVYARLFAKLNSGQCGASSENYTALDLGVVLAMTALSLNALVFTISKSDRAIGPDQLKDGLVTYAFAVLLILVLLIVRKIPVAAQFGCLRLNVGRVIVLGVALIAAAFPVIAVISGIIQMLMGDTAQPQEIVDYFRRSLDESDTSSQLNVVLLASLVAPLAEEFIFRGYFYGVLKKFAGIMPAMLVTSALFSAIHANLAAAAPLFLLAIALNIAYEVTGSLLVPMTMHAIFNATQLTLIYFLVHTTP